MSESTVFGGRLGVVACFAEGLMVLWAPEEPHVAAMRDDVIDDGRDNLDQPMGSIRVHAEWVLGEEEKPVFAPFAVVAALRGGFAGGDTFSAICTGYAIPLLDEASTTSGAWTLGPKRHYFMAVAAAAPICAKGRRNGSATFQVRTRGFFEGCR